MFLSTSEVRSVAPIVAVMLPEALAFVHCRSIWADSGKPIFKLFYCFASKKNTIYFPS